MTAPGAAAAARTCAIRPAVRADAAAINDIQNHYVVHSTATFLTEPVTLEQRLAWLENRPAAHPVIVAEAGGVITGWASLEVFRARSAYRHTTEFSLYVRHDCHRRGIGAALLADLTDRARAAGHHTLVGGCCSESEAVLALLEKAGYEHVARFREVGYKFGRWLDVVFMQRLL